LKTENILVVGDLHSPFTKKGYLQHCTHIYKKYKCNRVIFIGDVLDNHYSSFYEQNPDGYSAGKELDESIKTISKWYKVFPKAEVCLGNHDRLILRKAFTAGVSEQWIKGYSEVLKTPNWIFDISFTHNDVLYSHGEGATNILQFIYRHQQNVVVGHTHTQFQIVYSTSENNILFGMNVGCGIDIKRYTFEYAKFFNKRPIIGCGVVLNNGRLPILEPMKM
jgi:predicted phosphodiesterase